jgi:hypothetical protein
MEELTHQWCPKCNAMLPAHLERCPRCKANLKGGGSQMMGEIFRITAVIVGVGLIPFIVIVAIGLICINSMN